MEDYIINTPVGFLVSTLYKSSEVSIPSPLLFKTIDYARDM
jgi:hypothetical protein